MAATTESNKNKDPLLYNPLKSARWILGVGIILMLIAPWVLTRSLGLIDLSKESFSLTATTITGLTAPITSLIGAFLIYLALTAQVSANRILQTQLVDQRKKDSLEQESKSIHQLYSHLKSSIDDFSYTSLDPDVFGEGTQLSGSEAIYKLFRDFYCDYHDSEDEMMCNPKITELMSILELCDVILQKLTVTEIGDKEALKTLIKHQYEYRVFPFIRLNKGSFAKYRCEGCNVDHGLPKPFVDLVQNIGKTLAL